jgi:aminoglycoside phosphotransferase (APT) family kinase protein
VTNSPAAVTSTAAALLDTLREATGVADLDYREPPSVLSGGFWAEMLRFRLADPPAELDLDRDLVAKIVPDPAPGAWEAAVQRHVADAGFPTPPVRLTAPASGPLGRYVIVMDHVDGRPPMSGLRIGTVVSQTPSLMRRLPDQLARMAARLHALDPAPLAAALAAVDASVAPTSAGFVAAQVDRAREFGRPDIARAGERLLVAEPPPGPVVIAHGDLHPFNLLVTEGQTQLIDWTVTRIAQPGFTLGFTHLVLAHPPIALPRAGAAVVGLVGRSMAARFLRTYRSLTHGTAAAVDDAALDWHRRLHALRILVEMAAWDAAGTRPAAEHPWFVLEPVVRAAVGLAA